MASIITPRIKPSTFWRRHRRTVDAACPRSDRSKGGRPPSRPRSWCACCIQSLYNRSDEDCEYQVLDRMSFQRFCRLDGALHIPTRARCGSSAGTMPRDRSAASWLP
ncbi:MULTISPECIES: transposase [unclassified Rhizobacter]|uniref:transposase n=1 Tax=unclassified Rhizobacter TaxID=2640088 RepID=UPI000AFF857A|nr:MULTISPECIES: transposase [unclassified Rhizobacter]